MSASEQIAEAAFALACLDIAQATARLAERHNFTRPLLTDDSEFTIKSGRHPVVEQVLPASSFIEMTVTSHHRQSLASNWLTWQEVDLPCGRMHCYSGSG